MSRWIDVDEGVGVDVDQARRTQEARNLAADEEIDAC